METKELSLVIKMTLTAWNAQNNYLNKLVDSLTDEQLAKEVSPGKNTGHYLYGHLIAVSDAMLPVMGFGELIYPALQDVFIKSPDKSGQVMPTIAELKEYSNSVNAKLSANFSAASPEEWLSRHMSVSPEDFAKEPHRNKLNIVISRTQHMAYHVGQLQLLK